MLVIVQLHGGDGRGRVQAGSNAPFPQRVAEAVGVRQHVRLRRATNELIATCGDSSWRRAQRKRVGLLVEARAAVQCKAGDTPEPAPQLVEPRFGVLKTQFEAVVNVLIEVLQQLGLGVLDAVGDNFFQLGLQGVEGGFDLLGLATGVVDLEDALLEVEAAFNATQHFIACTEHTGEQVEFFGEQFQHTLVGLVSGVQEVDDHHVVALAVTVAAANALFDSLRVPRQVVIDDQRAELQVDTFGSRFSGDHDFRAGAVVLAEVVDQRGAAVHLRRAGDAIRAFVLFQPALVDGGGFLVGVGATEQHQFARVAVGGEKAVQVLLRAFGFREDDGLAWRAQLGHLAEAQVERLQ